MNTALAYNAVLCLVRQICEALLGQPALTRVEIAAKMGTISCTSPSAEAIRLYPQPCPNRSLFFVQGGNVRVRTPRIAQCHLCTFDRLSLRE